MNTRTTRSLSARLACAAAGLALASACGDSAPPPAPAAAAKPAAAAAPGKDKKDDAKKTAAAAAAAGGDQPAPTANADDYAYTSIGKRDPFQSPLVEFAKEERPEEDSGDHEKTPLEGFDVSQLKLVAIVTGVSNPRAMVEDPVGKGYVITRGTLIGRHRGRVSSIRGTEVIITERYRDVSGREVSNQIPLKLPATETLE